MAGGQQITTGQGSIASAGSEKPLTGQQISGGTGTIIADAGQGIAISGSESSSSHGNSASAMFVGLRSRKVVGGTASRDLSGAQTSVFVGVLHPTPLAAALGAQAIVQTGSVGKSAARALTGSASTGSTGTVQAQVSGGGNDNPNFRYVIQGGTGAQNGTDWNNAYSAVPANAQRGLTYYVADGNYPSQTFSTPVSGTTLATIKKATIADHGTNEGWNNTMGDGQAVFTAPIIFSTGFWHFNGATRNENDWFQGSAYGFRVVAPVGLDFPTVQVAVYNGSPTSGTIVEYVSASHVVVTGSMPTLAQYCFSTKSNGSISTNHVFRRCHAENGSNHYFIRESDGCLVEYCASNDCVSTGNNHGNVFNHYFAFGTGITIRYNKVVNAFVNADSGDGGTNIFAISDQADGVEIYGNWVWRYKVTNCVVGFNDTVSRNQNNNVKVFNNTFANQIGGFNQTSGIKMAGSTNVLVQNNLWVGTLNNSVPAMNIGSGTVSHNAFSTSSGQGTNTQLNVPTSIFVNYAAGDLRLASATSPGITLSSPYNVDLLGNTRGADGAWDRGAYEYAN